MKKHSLLIKIRNIVCATLALLVVLAVPTGWLYDLWAGTGTEQGQWPSEDVQWLQRQEDVETFFLRKTPATVSGGELVPCPLARLRDLEEEGTHYYHRGSATRSIYTSEYSASDYPVPTWQRFM